MKVLWFANTPCGAIEKLTGQPVTGGGWLYSLSEEVVKQEDVELHVAFYWGENLDPFEYRGIFYHPMYKKGEGSKWGRLINRFIDSRSNSLDLKLLPKLVSVVDNVNPDIIHIHGSENNFGMVASQKLTCPIVLSIQGLLSLYIFSYYRGYTKQEILRHEGFLQKLLMSGVDLNEKSFRRRGEMEKQFFKDIPNIIGRTFWDKAGSLALNPKRRYFEVGEIMRPEFYLTKWNKDSFSSPLTLTTTISSGYYKGLETIYQTAQVLKSAGFVFNWNVIGIEPTHFLAHLSQKKVTASADELSIELLGRKSAAEMVSLMANADVFVQVSHIENSPNSLGEAMLLGMPIIATFAGGTASMLTDNVEGCLIQDGDPYTLAGMIMEMSEDFLKAKSMADHAYETAHRRHKPEFVCSQLLNTYNTILSNNEC